MDYLVLLGWIGLCLFLTCLYGLLGALVFKQNNSRQMIKNSKKILIISLVFNWLETINCVCLGFMIQIDEYESLKYSAAPLILSFFSHNGLYVSHMVKILRLHAIHKRERGYYRASDYSAGRNFRFSSKWAIRGIFIYTVVCSLPVVIFTLIDIIQNNDEPNYYESFSSTAIIYWQAWLFFEEVLVVACFFLVRKTKSNLKLKLETILFGCIWGVSAVWPLTNQELYLLVFTPLKDISLVVCTAVILILGKRREVSQITIPLEVLNTIDKVFKSQKALKVLYEYLKEQNKQHWTELCDLYLRIQMFNLNPSLERCVEVYNNYINNKKVIPEEQKSNLQTVLFETHEEESLKKTMGQVEEYVLAQLEFELFPAFRESTYFNKI